MVNPWSKFEQNIVIKILTSQSEPHKELLSGPDEIRRSWWYFSGPYKVSSDSWLELDQELN